MTNKSFVVYIVPTSISACCRHGNHFFESNGQILILIVIRYATTYGVAPTSIVQPARYETVYVSKDLIKAIPCWPSGSAVRQTRSIRYTNINTCPAALLVI